MQCGGGAGSGGKERGKAHAQCGGEGAAALGGGGGECCAPVRTGSRRVASCAGPHNLSNLRAPTPQCSPPTPARPPPTCALSSLYLRGPITLLPRPTAPSAAAAAASPVTPAAACCCGLRPPPPRADSGLPCRRGLPSSTDAPLCRMRYDCRCAAAAAVAVVSGLPAAATAEARAPEARLECRMRLKAAWILSAACAGTQGHRRGAQPRHSELPCVDVREIAGLAIIIILTAGVKPWTCSGSKAGCAQTPSPMHTRARVPRSHCQPTRHPIPAPVPIQYARSNTIQPKRPPKHPCSTNHPTATKSPRRTPAHLLSPRTLRRLGHLPPRHQPPPRRLHAHGRQEAAALPLLQLGPGQCQQRALLRLQDL